MDSSSPSSSSSYLTATCKYDVFLSFRGEDTRENFTSHLFAALSRKKIKTFIDEDLNRGDEISPALVDAIEGSKISVIIFSNDYASSRWCLDEVVQILECKKMNGQIVIPVFYHVHPSDVRKQIGTFGKAFVEHEKRFKEMPEKVQKWRAVLTDASYLSGYESTKIRPEAKLVDVIVKDVLKKLEKITVSADFNGLVGINSRMERVKSLLSFGSPVFRIVGIWGMGGIGKTTLAEAIFKQYSIDFEGKCFMANVREKSEKEGGLEPLQKEILSHLLDEKLEKGGPNIPHYTMERLKCMKVFIVLDDVNTLGQLEYLAGGLDRFGSGSRIVVTTRNKEVLDEFRVDNIYRVKDFTYSESLNLFCAYAFRESNYSEDLTVLSKMVVGFARGNPLALKVLGCFFHKKSKLEWEKALCNLHQISSSKIHDVLKISYDELSLDEKSIFLDIACFFNGEDKGHVMEILDDSFVHYRLNILVDKSLITLSDNEVNMHDLLEEMGREIVRKESIKDPSKRSRLWNHEDIYHVLKKNKGTDSIEGMFLDMSKIRDLHLTPEAFANMSNLRLLKFYMPEHFGISEMRSKVHLSHGLDYLSDELRYLYWNGYPLKMLPMNFSPDNLIEVCLPYSKIQQLWEGEKEAFKLKFIDLQHSPFVARIPSPLETPNLQRVNLLNCINLSCIPQYIQNFNHLGHLSLSGCKSLISFSRNIHFRSPIKIDFSSCVNLTEFPQISGNIFCLILKGTAIEEVPSSIQTLPNLEVLNLSSCTMLKSISTNICKLKSLHELYLEYCPKLQSFPELLEPRQQLDYFHLISTKIEKLPSSIEKGHKDLKLIDCSELDSLPENLQILRSLEVVDAQKSAIHQQECRGLVLPSSLSSLSSLTSLFLDDCGITEIPESISCLISLEHLRLRENNFETLPTSIKQLSCLKSLHLKNCNMLLSIPELPPQLEVLDASNCEMLRSLPELPSCLEELDAYSLEKLSEPLFEAYGDRIEFLFSDCPKLKEKADDILAGLRRRIQHMTIASLKLFHLYEKEFEAPSGIGIFLPGSGVPNWFSNQCSGSSVTIVLPQRFVERNFIGFALCAVIEIEKDSCGSQFSFIECSYRYETKTLFKTECVDRYTDLFTFENIESDHVLLGFDPCWNVGLPNGHDLRTTVSMEFSVSNHYRKIKEGYKVKSCGVCPLYAHTTTFALEFGSSNSEEECSETRQLDNEFHDKAGMDGKTESINISDEYELEPEPKRICRAP